MFQVIKLLNMSSIFIGIGIDKFQDSQIPNLDFCVSDLKFIQRVFQIYNISNEFLFLVNDKASLKNIYTTIGKHSDFNGKITLFFSSHGEKIKNKTLLFCHDTSSFNIEDSSLDLKELIIYLGHFKSSNIKIFIDACNIDITLSPLPNNIELSYPNGDITYEDTTLNQSIFVNSLIKEITCSYEKNINSSKNTRYQFLRHKLSNFYILNNKNFVCISGTSGVGKSFFLKKIKKLETDTYYVNIPNIKGLTSELILNLINQEITKAQNINFDIEPESHILFFDSLHPYSLIIVDHLEHLPKREISKLIKFLKLLKSQVIVSTKQKNSEINKNEVLLIPNLSRENIIEISRELNIDQSNLYNDELLNSKTYISFLKNAYININKKKEHEINAIHAIIASGGYKNIETFCKCFSLNINDIRSLKQTGVLIEHDNFFYPHDSLYETIKEEEVIKLSHKACEYWKLESKANCLKSIYQYILIINTFNPNFNHINTCFFIKIINKLKGKNNVNFLLLIYEYLVNKSINNDLCIALSKALIEVDEFALAKSIILKSKSKSNCITLKAMLIECIWWEGDFDNCIKKASNALQDDFYYKIKYELLCSRGIAYFFKGEWKESLKDLESVIKNYSSVNNKSLFLSHCVLATIHGLRGTNFEESIIHFIHSLEIAKKNNRHSWIAIAYGNIGEIFWKSGFTESALKILEISEELSALTGNKALNLEINRNLLHAYYRANNKEKALNHIKKLEVNYNETQDSYVRMQLLNTLITHYILLQKNMYKKLLDSAYKLTKNNKEYKIYTYANIALVYLNDHKYKKAKCKILSALKLCHEGQNWLAAKQIIFDWDKMVKKIKSERLNSKQLFPKWHQILETKLSQQFHHLEHLCGYLEQSYTS